MRLIIFAALAALCSAEKLDRTYLPPASAKTAGGAPGSLQAPLVSGDELPAGGFVNEAQGVVVDAAAAGTRANPGADETGLGGPRESYGSTASKVGDAAFKEFTFSQIPNTLARIAPIPEHETVVGPTFEGQVFKSKTLIPQASKDYNSNTLSYQNNVESQKYNYGFQTDNGIAVGENGVAHDGSYVQGGYSYKGNDGQDYKVTYTADKEGYQPQGSHLPTPPPIPDDIIKSIEQNAKEEAAGHYDDGSYDPQKHNAEGDYADSDKHDDKLNLFGKRPGSQASGVIINQNNQAGSAFPGLGSVSTDKPLAFSTYKPVYGSSQSGQNHGFGSFGSSSFGQSGQGVHTPSKTQFGQSNFGSQQTITQFGSQFAQGSKPGFGSQAFKPQFGLSQPTQDSSILPSTPSSFTQFGSQSGQQSAQGFDVQQNKPLEGAFGQPDSSIFGASASNFGQAGSFNIAEKEYLQPVSNKKPVQGVDYQKLQFGVSSAPAFDGGVKPVGFGPQTQGSSAIASASVSGSQSSLSSLSPLVLEGLKSPSKSQPGQYYPQPSVPQFGSKPVGLSAVSKPDSTYPQNAGFVGDKNLPQPAGFLSGSEESNSGQHSKGKDHSYHYNQPAKPFNSPSSILQGSSVSAGQISQTNNEFSSFNSQKEQLSGSSKPFGSALPTASSGAYQSSYNGVTQAALSPFPSPSPTPVSSFPQKTPTQQSFQQGSSNLISQKPSNQKVQTFFGQTSSVASVESQKGPASSQNAPSVSTQPYTGELYEYNKPQQGIPAPTPSSTPSSVGIFGIPAQENHSQGSLSSSQFGQPSVSGSKPVSKPQFGLSQGSQSGLYFGNKQQGFQTQFNTQNVQGSQSQFTSRPTKPGSQFGTIGVKPQFGSQSSQGSFSQTQSQNTQSQPLKPFGSTSQFGFSGTKPQFSQGSQYFQQSTQGNKATNVYLPPISITSTLGGLGFKPQVGQGSQFSQGTIQQFTQSTQSTQSSQQSGSVTQQAQDSTTQFGEQNNKPFGAESQIGTQNKPQFGQGFFQQTTPQAAGSIQKGQGSQSQFGSNKPFGSQFGTQATKPQFSSLPQKSQGSLFQSHSTSQTVGTQQSSQGSLTQFGNQLSKPFSTSKFGVQESKPQFGQPQTSQGSSITQTQAIQQTAGTQQQPTFGAQNQFGSQSNKPFGSQFGLQGAKPQFGQVSQTQGTSIIQTQTTQQTVGSVFGTQQQTKPENVYLHSKPSTVAPQFGAQESKPQFGQVPSSQGSSFQQSTQTVQQTIGSLGLSGGQPSKPFGTSSQFGVPGSKPQGSSFTQTQQSDISSLTQQQAAVSSVTQQQSGQGFQVFGSQPSKPFESSQFGVQGVKPQSIAFGQSQTSQHTASSVTQQQLGQGSQVFGSQPSKPFGSLQFGVQGVKPQGNAFGQSQTSQQTVNSVTQQQSGQGSQVFGSQPSKPFGSSQFGVQRVKPQGNAFGQSQTSQQIASSVTQQQLEQGSQVFGSQPSKPFGSSQFGVQGVKPQSIAFGQSQTSQQTASSVTQQQSGQGSQVFGSQPSKPFGSSQFGVQGVKPQGNAFGQSQTSQQTISSVTQQQSGQGSQVFGSQPSKPFGSSQFGVQGVKPQGNAFGQSQTSQQTASSVTQQQSGQGSQVFGSQPSKLFGSSQFGVQGVKPQGSAFGQSQTSQQTVSSVTQQQSGQGSQVFGSQPSKPFESSQFGVQGVKPQGNAFGQSQTYQQTVSSVTQQQSGQGSQDFGSKPSKPFGSSQFGGQVKPQGSSFGQSQTTQQISSTVFQQQAGQGSQIFGSQPSKLFGSSQFGAQGNKPLLGQVPQSSPGSSLTQTQTIPQSEGSVTGTQQQPGSQTQSGSQSYKPFGTSQVAQGSKPQFGHTQTTQESTFSQSQFSQQSSSPAPFGTAFGTQPAKTEYGSTIQKSEGNSGSSLSQFGSQFGQPSTQGPSQFGAQAFKPFSTSHHQESKPQYGAPSKPAFGQSSTTYVPFTNNQNSQSQFGYQYKQPVNAFGKYEPKPLFGQTELTGFGSSQASSSASSYPQAFKGTQFGSQTYKPFGSQTQPIKSQYGLPTSSASAFASSSSTPFPVSGSKYSLQPLETPSSVFPTAQPALGQPNLTTPLGQGISGTQTTGLAPVQGSDSESQNTFGSGVTQASTPQPLGSKPDFGFGKPCCRANKFSQSTTASPSLGVSSSPSSLSTPHDVHGSVHKTEDFNGPKQSQGFDEKTGYYY